MKPLLISQVVSPHTFDYKEAIFYCKNIFGLTDKETNRILKHLINPNKIHPDKLYFYIARKGDELAGFAIVYYLHHSQLAYLEYIGVIPQFRREGIGSALYHYALDEIRNHHHDVKGMFYEVSQDQQGMVARVKFFVSQGAISFDIPYHLIANHNLETLQKSQLQLMYHPFDSQWFITGQDVPKVMANLTSLIL